MSMTYTIARIYTSEEARFRGRPLHLEIVDLVHRQKAAARCHVTRGVAGCFENGEVATLGVEVFSFNMPLEITVILPREEAERLLPQMEAMVDEGLMTVEDAEVRWHKSRTRMIPRQIRVRDVMTREPRTLHGDAPAAEALRILLDAPFHGLPVVDASNRPVGMVTHGDLLRHPELSFKVGMLRPVGPGHLQAVEKALDGVRVADVMGRPAVTVREDEMLGRAVDIMLKEDVKRLPVVDAQGALAGILSRLDVFRTIMDKAPSPGGPGVQLQGVKLARDAMRTDTPVLAPEAPVWDAIRLIETTPVRRVAVVGEDGRLLGLVSDKALMAVFSGHHGGLLDLILEKLPFAALETRNAELHKVLRSRTVGEVMRRDIVSVREEDDVQAALQRMVDHKLKRIPVLDAQGRFKGMLTRDSLLRIGTAP